MLIEQQIWQVAQLAANCDKAAICQVAADSSVRTLTCARIGLGEGAEPTWRGVGGRIVTGLRGALHRLSRRCRHTDWWMALVGGAHVGRRCCAGWLITIVGPVSRLRRPEEREQEGLRVLWVMLTLLCMLFTRHSRTSGAQFESASWQHSPETGSLGSRRTSCVPGRSIGLHRHMAYDDTGWTRSHMARDACAVWRASWHPPQSQAWSRVYVLALMRWTCL